MPFPVAKKRLISRIDSDRMAMERQGIRAALRYGSLARQHAYAAWRTTHDVHAVTGAIGNVLKGNAKLHLPGVVELVRDNMVASHLQGVRRTVINMQSHVDAGVKLSSAYDGAVEFLKRRLQLDPAQVSRVQATYGEAAAKVVNTASDALQKSIQEALLESIEAGDGTAGGVSALRQAFEDQGFVPAADHQLQAIFRTQTNMAYSAGRWQSLHDPDLGDLVWGFEFTAILDDRTTDICRPLDGVKRPKDDPFWNRFNPPNHYNCRSTTLEILDSGDATEPPSDAQPAKGFDFNPGHAYAGAVSALAGQTFN